MFALSHSLMDCGYSSACVAAPKVGHPFLAIFISTPSPVLETHTDGWGFYKTA